MTEVEQLQKQLEYSREIIAVRDRIEKLRKNKDFQYIIEELFMTKECAEYAKQSANFNMSDEQRESSLAMAQAAGLLEQFLSKYYILAESAERNIPQIEEQIIMIENEE